mmetsp:Transcript_18506/g.48042  ORF Transcript_18506/g.48042 Transcript_18506/m.48042 type:complete len:207 (-) Transcript_18506:92-712(-)
MISVTLFAVTTIRWFISFISFLASNQAPFAAFATLPSCAERQAFASAMGASRSPAAFSAPSRTAMGSATPEMSSEVRGAATSSRALTLASAASTFSLMALRMRAAALRSFLSSAFLRSKSSLLLWSRLHSSMRIRSVSSFVLSTLTFGRSFDNSALASTRGPFSQRLSSLLLALMYSVALAASILAVLITFSKPLLKSVYVVYKLR